MVRCGCDAHTWILVELEAVRYLGHILFSQPKVRQANVACRENIRTWKYFLCTPATPALQGTFRVEKNIFRLQIAVDNVVFVQVPQAVCVCSGASGYLPRRGHAAEKCSHPNAIWPA